jgi:hypothetical protein
VSRDLRFERMIDARPERVFDAFTSPEGQREFYGQDAPGWIVESRCDLRVVTFEARGEATLMTMIQAGFPTPALRDEHLVGLPNAFARLGRAVPSLER